MFTVAHRFPNTIENKVSRPANQKKAIRMPGMTRGATKTTDQKAAVNGSLFNSRRLLSNLAAKASRTSTSDR